MQLQKQEENEKDQKSTFLLKNMDSILKGVLLELNHISTTLDQAKNRKNQEA